MKNKFLSLAVICVLIICTFASCSAHSDEEIVSAASELIEKSYEVNEIYYGKGLPYTDKVSIGLASNYAVVDSECGYTTADALKKLAAEVYSADYCEHLYEVAFEGLHVENSDVVSYARYIEDYSGRLTVRKDAEETGLVLNRSYDLSTIKVEKCARNRATVSVLSLIDGKEDETLKINLVFEDNQWRLNTPTY